jgi:predicted GNAT family acetyltransferase
VLARGRPPRATPGALREAGAADEKLLATWSEAFHREAGLDPVADHLAFVRGKLRARQLFLWENRLPVSMVAWGGRTSQGVRIQYVYTPPPERKNGYASAGVAALSQRLLDEGSPRCFLFANASNRTANEIYRALGYEPMSDFRLYDFSGA